MNRSIWASASSGRRWSGQATRSAEPFFKFGIPSDFVLFWGGLRCHPTSLDNLIIVSFCIGTIIGLTNLGLPESVDRECRSLLELDVQVYCALVSRRYTLVKLTAFTEGFCLNSGQTTSSCFFGGLASQDFSFLHHGC